MTQDVAGIPGANKWFDKAGTPADTLKKLPKAHPKSVYASEFLTRTITHPTCR